jgi:hypothetical protein
MSFIMQTIFAFTKIAVEDKYVPELHEAPRHEDMGE